MDNSIWPWLGLRNPISATTHFVAFLLAIAAGMHLWRRCHGQWRLRLPTLCFSAGMILLYAASATYHALQLNPDQLQALRRLDHCAIFLLITGSFTPPLLLLLPPGWRRRIHFTAIWTLGIAGIASKWIVPDQPYWLEISYYFGMGWFALLILHDLVRCLGHRGLRWVAYGGIFYTLGGIADFLKCPVIYPHVFGYHEFFHVLTMCGTACHVVFIGLYVLPYGLRPLEAQLRCQGNALSPE
jgi:hemolysin III